MAARAATDYYRILGVARDADAEAIRRAYRALARVTHTDAAEIPPGLFDLITEARDVLLDPQRRDDYDAALAAGSQPRPGEPRPAPPPANGRTNPPADPRPVAEEAAVAGPRDGPRGPGVFGQLRGLELGRGLRWAVALGALAAALTALRVVLLPVPAGLPFAPSAGLGLGGGVAGRAALSAVGAAVLAPWAAVWWWDGRRRGLAAALAGALAVLATVEFVCAAAVMSGLALACLWLIRTAWRALLWVYGAP